LQEGKSKLQVVESKVQEGESKMQYGECNDLSGVFTEDIKADGQIKLYHQFVLHFLSRYDKKKEFLLFGRSLLGVLIIA
jgi:hypothetical protein